MLLEIIEFIKDSIGYILVVIFVIFLAMYVVAPTTVNGPSMDPTLKDGEVVLLNKLRLFSKPLDRFDIVVIKFGSPNYIIKRIIGLPGETVEYKDNQLLINNEIIAEPYINNDNVDDFGPEKVPLDMYFVVGDNYPESIDSRDERVGMIRDQDIIGKSSLVIWPLNKIRFAK